ncbi:MAG: NADH-quinone oxidoreductase subunit J family protein [Candidatus Njordarchaeia archaeon]
MAFNLILLSLGLIAILSSILTLETKELMHGAFFLGLLLVTLGEIYILLGAAFVGLVQILVYGGGVTVLMLFAMLFIPRKKVKEYPSTFRAAGVVISLLLISLILLGISFATTPRTTGFVTYPVLANALITQYDAAILAVGLILFSVILSASYIAGERRDKYE